jgi:hypothetical protein
MRTANSSTAVLELPRMNTKGSLAAQYKTADAASPTANVKSGQSHHFFMIPSRSATNPGR